MRRIIKTIDLLNKSIGHAFAWCIVILILGVSYESADLAAVKARLSTAGTGWVGLGEHSTRIAKGRFIRVLSPAGLRIEMFERNPPSP